jgi:hypothetical protein
MGTVKVLNEMSGAAGAVVDVAGRVVEAGDGILWAQAGATAKPSKQTIVQKQGRPGNFMRVF